MTASVSASAQPSSNSPGTAIISGAASQRGIGRGIARRLASRGWALGLLDIDEAGAKSLADELSEEFGIQARAAQADVGDSDAVDRAAEQLEASLPAVTAVINAAGISDPTPLMQTDVARWDRIQRVNATSTFLVSVRFARGMVERGYGRIVNVSSTAAQTGGGTYSAGAYAASKASIVGFTNGLALELAPHGVTVNAISPAIIDTDIMGGTITPDRAPTFTESLPVGRLGKVSEVAGLVEFLIGPDAGYITGATYNINGGARIG